MMRMTFNRITRCWNCGKESNRATVSPLSSKDGVEPKNGDANFCIYCGSLAIFDDSFSDGARKPSPSELDQLKADKDVLKLLLAWMLQHGADR
jgi:hypothetical protein